MRFALYFPPFGELSDPAAVLEVAAAAEASGWDGVFLWDHLYRDPDKIQAVADPWILLAAMAATTRRIRLGPLVTPLTRRRPQKLARETVTLDRLSGGRLTLGIGLGVDSGGELTRFGEVVDQRQRGQRLDESLELLLAFWSGEPVSHRGEHFVADGVRFLPGPLQQPRIPIWAGARGGGGLRPLRRAARLDGLYPVDTDRSQLESMLAVVATERGSLEGFDVAYRVDEPRTDIDDLGRLGVTWGIWRIPEGASASSALDVARRAPLEMA
jgi:alkanesulfonate monooxygenase SsuD/methylene tetrahydromethanopterin reductase-like flavin-dependent oxidoreductase (luciferase family)